MAHLSTQEFSLDSAVLVREMLKAADTPDWHAGSTEPWVVDALCALCVANGTHTAIEIGGFEGFASKRIARALCILPHDTSFTVCEIDPQRADFVQRELDALNYPSVNHSVVCADSHEWIPTLADESVDFAWIDGNHEQPHVAHELLKLWPKMRRNGIITLHDVFGVCDLDAVVRQFGGYSIDLPRLGPAGGLGVIQIRA